MRPRLFFRPSFFLRKSGLFLLAALTISAQETAILKNNDEPMRVAYACAEEDLQWAGMSCTADEPCTIYLELSSVAANGKRILVAGNVHSSSATLGSVLLLSDNSGATWKEPAPRIRGSALDQLQFYNPQTGWAAGETQYPLTRDPFFLLTTDGGVSWHPRPVGEEDSAGSVQRFWFDSAQHGEAIVDAGKASTDGRYLSYDSETGGENWTLAGKSDRLPKLRRAPAAAENPEWRLGPSKDGKASQVEQRVAGRWTPVASFLIEVANCGPKP
jgi:hypothetical protein